MKYKLQDLIDIEHFQNLQDSLNGILPFPSAIIDNENNILTATAWQDICTQFHRKSKACEQECRKSDQYILSHLDEVIPAASYRCAHGLVDHATPIIINGVHYGDFFTGQFFLEKPDLEFFRAQAKKYGFDEDAYLEALAKVPIWTREQLDSYRFFIKRLIVVISESGLKKLRETEARKQFEESEEHANTILRQMHDGFVVANVPDGRMVDANEAMCHMLGYTRDEMLKLSLADVGANESPEAIAHRIQRLMQTGSARCESRFRRKDGTLLDVEVSVTYLPKRQVIFAFYRDITQRKRAEEAMQASEARYRRITEGLTDYQYTVRVENGHAVETTHSPACAVVTGYTAAEFEADSRLWVRMVAPEHRELVRERARQILAGNETPPIEHLIQRKDGEARWVITTIIPHRDASGRLVAYDGVIKDITERKRAEREKEILEAQNRQLQKSESLGCMAKAIAHHFNNQLQVVMMNLEMAMHDLPAEAEPVEKLREALRSVHKAAEVSSLMLAYLGQTQCELEPLDLSEACRQSLPMLRAAIPKYVVMETDMPAPGPAVNGNANQIQQVLTNLVTNAWEASGDGPGVIRLTVKTVSAADIPAVNRFPIDFQPQENGYACLEVADAGCGIADMDIERVFDPFYSSKVAGRGMGLPVVLGIVRAYQGVITMVSKAGRGSDFRVFLPLSAEAVSQKPVQAVNAPQTARGGTVLLVEDESSLRKVITLKLKSLGFSVLATADGVEAVEVFRQHQAEIRLVLCDLTMPRMDGWETLTALRQLAPGIPVILSSGYDEAQVMAGNHPERPQAFLNKPYAVERLSEAILQALSR